MPTYKDEKRKTWYVKYSAKDPLTGKRKQILKRGFEKKADAQRWEAQQKSMSDTSTTYVTFKQLAEQYYMFNKPKPRTQHNQTKMLETYFDGYELPLNKLTKAYMTQWYLQFTSLELKPTTMNILISVIKSVFKFGTDHFNYPNNASHIKRVKEPRRQYTTWTIDEFNQFISVVDRPIFKALFTFYYYTGCRHGEATSLRKSDFDMEKHTVHIQRNLKTESSDRLLKLPESLWNEILPILNMRKDDEEVFPIPPTTVYTVFKQYIQKAGVTDIRIHDLRHSFATNAIGNGANIVAVSKYLGHANINRTLTTYAHLLEKSEDELVSAIDSWMK